MLSIILIFSFLELVVVNISDPLHNTNFYFDTPIPYVFLIFLIPYYTSGMEKYLRRSSTIAKISVISIIGLSFLLMLLQRYPIEYSAHVVTRFLSGPYMIDFLFSLTSILSYLGLYIFSMIKPIEESAQDTYIFGRLAFATPFFQFRLLSMFLLSLLYYVLLKHKFDYMIKTDYLAKIRIKNEYVVSTEKLEILMPKFVLTRIDNFTMSRKYKTNKITFITINRQLCG